MTTSGDSDTDGVKTASNAFYAALPILDDGTHMQTVWANEPYVTYVGPDSTSVVIGWDEQKRYWEAFNKEFTARSVSIAGARIHVVGGLAWEIGTEGGHAQMKDGSTRNIDWIVTNIFEKRDGRWLMVSHHAQLRPCQQSRVDTFSRE